jgi:hypothetical protein
MSTHELKPGDRVRVRVGDPDRGYHAGDKGTVCSGPHRRAGSGRIYYVMMDAARPNVTPIGFRTEEIEPDV